MVMFGIVVSTAIVKVGKCREEINSREYRDESELRSYARERCLSPGARRSELTGWKEAPPSSPGRCVALIVAMETWAAPEISHFTLSWGPFTDPRGEGTAWYL